MNLFLSHSMVDGPFASELSRALKKRGHTTMHVVPSDIARVVGVVPSAIRSSDALVALVREHNSNVFFEIGLATGAGVPTLLAVRVGEDIPFDLCAMPVVALSGDAQKDAMLISHRLASLELRTEADAKTYATAKEELEETTNNPSLLEKMSPKRFESLIARYFEEAGYTVEREPIAALADLSIRAPDGRFALVEIKKVPHQNLVPIESVRQLVSMLAAADIASGLLISSSGFTSAALAMAEAYPITLLTPAQILQIRADDLFR
jgi:hypothetical protein